MFGFLAAFGPIGIAAAVIGTVGTVAYGALKDDEYETTTFSNKNEKKAEARAEVRHSNRQKIHEEIKQYEKKQIKRLKEKYNADIEFAYDFINRHTTIKDFGIARLAATSIPSTTLVNNSSITIKVPYLFKSPNIIINNGSNVNILSHENSIDTILALGNETKEIIELIKDLEGLRDESIA